ncbi:MAG: hypothetical protein CVT74_05705 [Alphaproteobacteria bacterium HGW-Alphaproteobacteria-13]|nr:MAG: hypothetical protein CVT74_05705 [Alphaproteobacteria bacterium HGW-Alphaproteobacteria-13]
MEQARHRFTAFGERDPLLRLPGDSFDLQLAAKRCTCTVREVAADTFLLTTDAGDRVEYSASVIDRYRRRLRVGARERHCSIIDQGSAYLVSVGGEAHYVGKLERGVMRAPFPSVVVRVLVAEGDRVARGQALFVVESMKVETTIAAEMDGVVTALLAQPAVHVAAGDLMARLAEEADAAGSDDGGFEFPVRYRSPDDDGAIGRAVAAIEGLICGYEPAATDVERAAAQLQAAPRGPDLDAAECALLDRFRTMHAGDADASDEVRFRRARSVASLPRQVEMIRGILRRWRMHGPPATGVGVPMCLASWAEAIDPVSPMLADLARSTLRRSARQSPRGMARDFELWRLDRFDIAELERESDLILIDATARDSRRDRRLFAFAETAGGMEDAERLLLDCLDRIREHHGGKAARSPYAWNRVTITLRQAASVDPAALKSLVQRAALMTRDLSIDQISFKCRVAGEGAGERIVITTVSSHGDIQLGIKAISADPIRPFSDHRARSAMLERRGLVYPYDLIRLLTSPGTALSDFPQGRFTEYDLDAGQTLVAVDRDWGGNIANLVVGEIVNFTQKFPEGIRRMIILGDPSKGMGSLGEAECRRILGALDRAAQERIPVEWFAVSSGARVSMESGTENLDWTARVLRRIIELSRAGHEINIIVCGVNVGAQSYWNAEATMLMEGRGMLIMVGDSAMVLTGKRALDYSGGVSAENETGIGGYDRIMGPNGEAQHWAPSIEAACRLLFRHYDFCHAVPAEGRARRRASGDPADRDICLSPHRLIEGSGFTKVGEIFDDRTNADRKKAFDIRSVMRAVADMDDMPLERWENWAGAEATVVWDAHIGGYPVRMVGFESYDLARDDPAPPDGPDRWTAGTLFPQGSKKAAKAIRRASANRPLVILANLSGFDGSPESMRRLQLESGAEIGRAIVEFEGPILFCLLSRYHGGAFVVFSKALNSDMEVIAIRGAKASVLGGAPAAAVVFASEIEKIVREDPDIARLRLRGAAADLAETIERKRLDLQAEWAARYDRIHDIERALEQGSIDRIVEPTRLRPEIIAAIGRKYGDITNV